MNAVLAFEQYLVLKRHFTDPKFYLNDRDQRFPVSEATYIKYGSGCAKLVKKYGEDVYNYFIANFVAGDPHGGLYNGDDARDNYLAWKKRNQSLSYIFEEELKAFNRKLAKVPFDNAFFGGKSGDHPPIFKAILGKRLSMESLLLLDRATNCIANLDDSLRDDFIWQSTSHLAKKYQTFFTPSFDPLPVLEKYFHV